MSDIPDWPLVTRGDDRFPVRPLQQLLRARGRTVAVDGIFGPKTEAAVKVLQQNAGLTADGRVGRKTWPKLVVQVRKGDTGDGVRGVQEVIQFHDQSDNPPNHVDGIFGPKTDGWVRGFQEAIETTVDGIVGPITWRALVAGMLSG
jgi:peptidoglycan hydrolase-like protein with peptidoglycan-binding domain